MGFKILFSKPDLNSELSSFKLMATKKMKLQPLPNSDLQIISPSNIFVIFLEMCSPRPIPFVLSSLVDSRNPNSLNSFGRS